MNLKSKLAKLAFCESFTSETVTDPLTGVTAVASKNRIKQGIHCKLSYSDTDTDSDRTNTSST